MNKRTTILLLILALSACLRFYTASVEPLPSFDDEIAHYAFTAYVGATGQLPDFAWSKSMDDSLVLHGREVKTKELYTYQNYQQPLYYVLAAMLVDHGPTAIRLLSVLFVVLGGAILTPFVYDRVVWAIFLLLPGSIVALSVVTNQSLVFFAVCLFTVACIKQNHILLFLAAFILGLSKATGLVMILGAVAYFLRNPRQNKEKIALLLGGMLVGVLEFVSRVGLDRSNAHIWSAITSIPAWIARLSDAFVSGLLHPALDSGNLLVLPIAVFCIVIFGYWITVSFIRDRFGIQTWAAGAGLLFTFAFMGTSSFGQGRWFYEMVPLFVTMGYGKQLNQGGRE